MREQLIRLAVDTLYVLIPILVAVFAEFLRRKIGAEKLNRMKEIIEAKESLAIVAVRFVEQAYKDFGGAEKYDAAAEWLADMSAQYGFPITDAEIKGLIESALRKMKDEFADQWTRE